MQTTSSTNYRSILSQELIRRIKANSAYSLRRFAHQLGFSPATLSGVLSGKRSLSLKAASKISEKLNYNPQDATRFYQAVASDRIRSGTATSQEATPEYLTLSDDIFQIMSDWHYFAILELTFLKSCRSDPRWCAKKLGINYNQANDAIERLKNLGLLDSKGGKLSKATTSLASSTNIPSPAIRSRHKQILQKAIESLDVHPIEERDFTSMTMAIDPSLLPEAKKRIAAFRRELCRFLESGKRKRVYEMSLQLFPLSEGEKNGIDQ